VFVIFLTAIRQIGDGYDQGQQLLLSKAYPELLMQALKIFAKRMYYPNREKHERNKTAERNKIIYLKPSFAHNYKTVSDMIA
jgi:hypothetical protein